MDRIEPADDGIELAHAIEMALDDASLKPGDIDYICLDAAGTKIGDVTETKAIKQVFNSHSKDLLCSAPKSIYGNMLGACGAVDVIATVLLLWSIVLFPQRSITLSRILSVI